jgi:hypothetical protein
MLDECGYPLEEDLEKIRNFKGNIRDFLKLIKECWNYADSNGFHLEEKEDFLRLELHTFGWSGNETVVSILNNTWFWCFYWQMSLRGGHYWFEINLKVIGNFADFGGIK